MGKPPKFKTGRHCARPLANCNSTSLPVAASASGPSNHRPNVGQPKKKPETMVLLAGKKQLSPISTVKEAAAAVPTGDAAAASASQQAHRALS